MNSNEELDALVWNLKLVLDFGEVNLGDDATVISLIVSNNTELRLTYNDTLDDESDFSYNASNGEYGTRFLNIAHNDEVLDPGEICRFFIMLDRNEFEIQSNEEVIIIILSGAAMLKVFKTAPTGISPGLNILR
ncbi:MAG: hypothetical protein ACTSWY_07005 [Promethearchaeota archaeon]